jgi:hypothetical protein
MEGTRHQMINDHLVALECFAYFFTERTEVKNSPAASSRS